MPLPPVPYCDQAGYLARCKIAPQDVQALVAAYPGFLEHRIARASSLINARLQKRYVTPLGQAAPPLVAVGTLPPPVSLDGRPVLGSLQVAIEVLVPGAVGAATFWWSADSGATWTLGPTMAATGPTPPVVTVSGTGGLAAPSALVANIVAGGALGTARFVWSVDGGPTRDLASAMVGTGTSPPGVTLTGTSTVAVPANVQIQITTGGPLGTAIFQWSQDGGVTWTTGLQTVAVPVPLGSTGLSANFSLGTYSTNNLFTGQGLPTAASVALGSSGFTLGFGAGTYSASDAYTGQGIVTAPTVSLGATGLTAAFPPGTYSADNEYSAPTPVPEIALGWLVAMVDVDLWQRRGANPQDPTVAQAIDERASALAELKEAADAKDGLFELPTNDQSGDSPTQRSQPMSYTEASPFVCADWMQQQAIAEDAAGIGTYGLGPPLVPDPNDQPDVGTTDPNLPQGGTV